MVVHTCNASNKEVDTGWFGLYNKFQIDFEFGEVLSNKSQNKGKQSN